MSHMPAACLLLLLTTTKLALAEAPDPWRAVKFLEGSWEARTVGGSAAAQSAGSYTFAWELKGHVLARHGEGPESCQGPTSYDCGHNDLLYVYQEAPGQALKAIYFDNEGHVIHYAISTPDPSTAVFLSPASPHGPQFRLIYQLKDALMSGKFQVRGPGEASWKTYLEWSGAKK